MDRQRKRELRELNARAWAGENDVFSTAGPLDSSLKKNTAFIKRLRTAITAASLPAFLQEIRTLSLHKYLSEVIVACYEGICRLKLPGELAAGVEIVSLLHQRFGPQQFTSYLGWYIGRGLSTPDKSQLKALAQDVREKEERERLSRQRVLLKVATDLWLVGVLKSLEDVARPEDAGKSKETIANVVSKTLDSGTRGKSGLNNVHSDKNVDPEPFPLEALKDMLAHDRDHANLGLVVLFVKSFSWDILGARPLTLEGRKSAVEDGLTGSVVTNDEESSSKGSSGTSSSLDDLPLTTCELQQRFKNVLKRYFEDVKGHIIRDQKILASQSRRNAEAYVKSGEVFEDRQAQFEKQTKMQEKLISNAQVLCEALEAEMPDLTDAGEPIAAGTSGIGIVRTNDYLRGPGEGAGIWEDEEERRFYENRVDLKERVPGILLEDGKKRRLDHYEHVGKKLDSKSTAGNAPASKDKGPSATMIPPSDVKSSEADDPSTVIVNKTVGAQVDSLLARLPELSSKDQVDELSIDFCFLNSKASRNRLLKAIQEVPKGRSDLLPLWSRLVATLGRYMPDISEGIVGSLDEEFRSLQRRKQKDFLGQVRTSNIRYLAELTKFGVVPEHVIFHCLRVCLEEFSRMNIEIICNLLENCGRYLLRTPETSPRMFAFLATLQRKKSAQHLGQQERMLLENAMYFVDPPARPAIRQKERDPVDLYLRRLVYMDLNKRNYSKVVKQIRKLHWEEQEVVGILHRIFAKPGKIKHSNIYLLAIICGALFRYHQRFVVSLLDDLLEHIIVGLEQNDFKFNQRRISEVKYLGELYNYKVVDSSVVFDTLYKIVTLGHGGGTPVPGRFNPLDMPDDFFRVRLACTMLDTCGLCFDRGSAKRKLDFFLTFFQYYIYTKEPLPMDVEFMLQDTFSLVRPQWKIATSLAEAGEAFAEAVAQNYKGQELDKNPEPEELDDSSSPEDEMDEERNPTQCIDEGQSSSEDVECHENEVGQRADSDFDDERFVVTRPDDERDPEAEAEFDRELAKMMAEGQDARKNDRKPVFDVPLPMRRAPRETSIAAEDNPSDGAVTPPNTLIISMLTRKGNRQQTRTVELPSDSSFAVAMMTQQQAKLEEQKRIKDLVMNYNLRDDDEIDGPVRQSTSHTSQTRPDRMGNHRNSQRTKRLQMSDVDCDDRA